MSKSGSLHPILLPGATVFFSSCCIMVLEIVAGRLVAKNLGSSLYTWTSVIGVVLAGISIGNYIGGRVADRYAARKSMGALFGLSSVTCVGILVLDNLVGGWTWLWRFGWPMRVFSHVSLVLLTPSILLGTISPVVTKMALDRGLPAGRTVGDIYAWCAAGSIAGTFLAGFYLIAAIGTAAIVWMMGAALLLTAILYWARLWVLYLWAAMFAGLLVVGITPAKWAETTVRSLALRKPPDPSILYEDESQYSYIAVRQLSTSPDERKFFQDNIGTYNRIIMDDIRDLRDSYTRIYAAATRRFSQDKNNLAVLIIGGGGYVFPRYVEEVWPGSRIDVVEIDPRVTEAAMKAFGLQTETTISTVNMDARNYVDELLAKERTDGQIQQYDFIYEDAFNDYSIPYQLVSKEFNDKISRILTDDGLYMLNLIEVFGSGRLLAALVKTLEKTFPNVYVVSEITADNVGHNFVVIAAKQEIELENLRDEKLAKTLDLWILSDSEIETLKEKTRNIVLTDNYSPLENLLAPVVRERGMNLLGVKYLEQAKELKEKGKWDASISKYEDAISAYAPVSIAAYTEIAWILAEQGKWEQAINAAKSALEYNAKAEVKRSVSSIHHNISLALKKLGRNGEASKHLNQAVQGYQQDLAKEPGSITIISRLGDVHAEKGNFAEATKYFQQAVDMNPFDSENRSKLAQTLVFQERYDEAIEQLHKGIRMMLEQGREDDAAKLQERFQAIEGKSITRE